MLYILYTYIRESRTKVLDVFNFVTRNRMEKKKKTFAQG